MSAYNTAPDNNKGAKQKLRMLSFVLSAIILYIGFLIQPYRILSHLTGPADSVILEKIAPTVSSNASDDFATAMPNPLNLASAPTATESRESASKAHSIITPGSATTPALIPTPGPTSTPALIPTPGPTSAPVLITTPGSTSTPALIPTPGPTSAPVLITTPGSTSTPAREPSPTPAMKLTPVSAAKPTPIPAPKPTPEPKRDDEGRLLRFKKLIKKNEDVKGWLMVPGTNIDYVVLQSSPDPEYYLFKDIDGKYSKAGSLFLDERSSVEKPTKNFVIHGHNMISTPEKMFHYIKFYKDVSYYKKHPLMSFDTLYEEGDYKVFAIIKTTPKASEDYFFEYRQSSFEDASEFLNFVYQIRIRSLIIVDDVDINENDQLLTLSTCSYEVDDNYRTVVFARKIREGEDSHIDLKSVRVNRKPLYCDDYYERYGGKSPTLPATFEKALKGGSINWYTPPKDTTKEDKEQ